MNPQGNQRCQRQAQQLTRGGWTNSLTKVTGEGAAIQGIIQGAEDVRKVVLDAREIYQHQEVQFTSNYGDNGFLKEYTCQIQGEPTRVAGTVHRKAPGRKAQHLVVNHRPRNSVLLFARLMGEKYGGTALAKYVITSESEANRSVQGIVRMQEQPKLSSEGAPEEMMKHRLKISLSDPIGHPQHLLSRPDVPCLLF